MSSSDCQRSVACHTAGDGHKSRDTVAAFMVESNTACFTSGVVERKISLLGSLLSAGIFKRLAQKLLYFVAGGND